VIQNGALQGFQFPSRIHPEFSVEDLARPVVHLKGLSLPSGAVKRQHQASVEYLAQRHFAHESAEVGHELQMAAAGELGIDPPFESQLP
jgi:hypothetical protein